MATDPQLGVARLVWLNVGATSASAEWVKTEVAKLGYLVALGAHRLDEVLTLLDVGVTDTSPLLIATGRSAVDDFMRTLPLPPSQEPPPGLNALPLARL